MSNLQIDLQEGFDGEPVVIRVNGTEVFRGEVSTRLQIGLAEQIKVNVPAGQVDVIVELPQRAVSASTNVSIPDVKYIGVSVEDDREDSKLLFRATGEFFRYM